MKALSAVRRFIRDERGVTAIEYGLIASVNAVAVAAALDPVQTSLKNVFDSIKNALDGTTP